VIDLNDFKDVKDRPGHQAGDEVVRDVAWRLTPPVRRSDGSGRIGGAAFVRVLRDEVLTQPSAKRWFIVY